MIRQNLTKDDFAEALTMLDAELTTLGFTSKITIRAVGGYQQRRDAELFEFARTNSMAASIAHDRFHEVGNALAGLLFAEESKAGQREDRDLEEALRTERRLVEQAVADYDYDYDLMLPTLTRWRIRCDELAGLYGPFLRQSP